MKTNTLPVRVKESVVRGVALQVLLLALSALYWRNPFLMYILAGDFFLRAFISPKLSPLNWISRGVLAKILPFQEKLVVLRPKKFAAAIGFFLSAGALAFTFTGQPLGAVVLLGMLVFFSFLESVFRFCAGCKIFGLLIKLGLVKEELCEDCVFPGEGI